MTRSPLPFAIFLGALTLMPSTPTLAQTAATAATTKVLPLVPNRFAMKKEQWTPADRAWIERDAITQSPNLVATLAGVADLANGIEGDPASPTYGWYKTNLYRRGHRGPTNSRLMEPVYTLAWAYTLNKPWNPYYRDVALRERMEAGIAFWLTLQGKDGGFSENGGKGAQELPSTSFVLEFLVEMYEMLDKDGTADPKLRAQLFDSIQRAVVWSATDKGAINQGVHYSNQYCGALYAMYRLWELTGDQKWKTMFDTRLDYWLENAQPALFWLEGDGVETFAYSQVTEWEMDRLLMLTKDPRILESFRKYYEWCSLNTLPENDGVTFVMDIAGNERTTPKELPNLVGYYNHIMSVLPEARPFETRYNMTDAEREKHIADWFVNPIPPADRPTGRDMTSGYHPFHNYPMYFEPLGMWTQSDAERRAQMLKLPTLSQPRFTRYFNVEAGKDGYLFARRPGVYATMHWGRSNGRQIKGLGLVWLPGFGTLIRPSNEDARNSYVTQMGKENTFRKSIVDFKLPASFDTAAPDGTVEAGDLRFSSDYDGKGISKSFAITDNAIEVTTRVGEAATEQIPLYLDAEDTISVDGKTWDYKSGDAVAFAGRTLRVKRVCGGQTAYATLEFGASTTGNIQRSYDLARGGIYMLSVAVPANADFVTRIAKG